MRPLLAALLACVASCSSSDDPPPTADAAPGAVADAAPGAVPDAALATDAAGPPILTEPALLLPGTALYPRAIRLSTGAVLASVVTPLPSGHMGGTILRSDDDGVSFSVIGHIDDPITASGLCCATLFELPAPVGGLAAGTLLWSASVGGDTPSQPMTIVLWVSGDAGATWTRHATIATGGAPRSEGGLWEPEFALLPDGALACHYSDETDPAHSQKLVQAISTDCVAWSAPTATVALAGFGPRPGMPNIRRLPSGTYVMTYEICGVAGVPCSARLRLSADGRNWGDPGDAGLSPATVDGRRFAHAPTLAWSDAPGANGRFYLVGQMVYDGAGNVAADSGQIVLANSEAGVQRWYPVPAPVPIAAPSDNFCPNYSSSLLPLDGGQVGLEIATRWDGAECRAYFARGALLGSGDATGVADGGRYRLVNVMSGHCLDVSGGSAAAGTTIQQWTCNGLAPQDWTLSAVAGGRFALRAENSGLCLTVRGGASAPGAAIEQQPCDGSAAQAWSPRNVGIGAYVLAHDGSDVCLDDSGGSTAAGNPMQLWSCNQLAPQIWQLEPR